MQKTITSEEEKAFWERCFVAVLPVMEQLETAGMTLKATARRALASHAPINLAAYRALREAQALGANLTLEEDGATVLIQADAQIDEELLDRLIAVKPHLINLLILGYAKLESQDA